MAAVDDQLPAHPEGGATNSVIGKRSLDAAQEAQVLEMAVSGLSSAQIAQALAARGVEVSKRTVSRTLRRIYDEATEERKHAQEAYRSKQVLQLDGLIRSALVIVRGTKCTVCQGQKLVWKDPLEHELGQDVCPKCEGSGLNEDVGSRLRAMAEVRGSLERQAKLLGLDSPTQISGPGGGAVPVALDVSGLDDSALKVEMSGFFPTAIEGSAEEVDQPGESDGGRRTPAGSIVASRTGPAKWLAAASSAS